MVSLLIYINYSKSSVLAPKRDRKQVNGNGEIINIRPIFRT
jgi:hypothetical protein